MLLRLMRNCLIENVVSLNIFWWMMVFTYILSQRGIGGNPAFMNENTSAQKEFIFIPDTCSCKHLCMYSFIHTIHPPTLFIQMCGTWSIEWFNKVPLVHLRHILYGLLMCKVIKWFHLWVFRFFNCRPTAQPFGDTSAEFRHIKEWWGLLWNVFLCLLFNF